MRMEIIGCSPCQIMADIASTMRARAKEKNLNFEVKLDGMIPRTIQTDPTRLRQILTNLVGNAIKFTDTGRVRLTLSSEESGGQPQPAAEVRGDRRGIGMTTEQIGRIFQPFAQGDNSTTRKFGGTGLGLSISHIRQCFAGFWRRRWTMPGGENGRAIRFVVRSRPIHAGNIGKRYHRILSRAS